MTSTGTPLTKTRRVRGVFEYPKDSGIFYIHWYDHAGNRHREKVGPDQDQAITLYESRKAEAWRRRKLASGYDAAASRRRKANATAPNRE